MRQHAASATTAAYRLAAKTPPNPPTRNSREAHFNYGPSVASSVFIACSFAKLARLRGYRYTVDVRDYGKPGRYLVGFIPAPSQEAISALGPEFEKHDPSQVTDSAMFDRICPKS